MKQVMRRRVLIPVAGVVLAAGGILTAEQSHADVNGQLGTVKVYTQDPYSNYSDWSNAWGKCTKKYGDQVRSVKFVQALDWGEGQYDAVYACSSSTKP